MPRRITGVLVGLLSLLTAAAFAQKTPAHHGLSSLFHRHPAATQPRNARGQFVRGHSFIPTGRIIGNKRTKVYHLPGQGGALPDPQNRVYFSSEAQAIRAGYHRAGQGGGAGHGSRSTGRPMSGHMMGGHMMGHGTMGHGMMGHGMMGHSTKRHGH